jgi:hypothetical protein
VFATLVEAVCTLYAYAPLLAALGAHIVSCDEMSGVQALERIAPTLPMRPGRPKRQEFEYKRHGTLSPIVNFDIVTGQVVAPSIGPRRTEADFTAHIAQTVATDPEAVWVFVTDQLNTHQSESLVRLVAQLCDLEDELGVKGETGILQTMATRAAFSILVRRVIKHGNFTSVADLQAKILAFIDYFNQTAKPFRWTYTGRPLVA